MAFSSSSTAVYPSFSTQNFYSGSNLNRLSWLRTDSDFLNSALSSPKTRFLLLENLNPLVDDKGYLETLSWDQVKDTILETAKLSGWKGDEKSQLFGPKGYNLNSIHSDEKEAEKFNKNTQGLNSPYLALVFLGIDETGLNVTSLPGELAGLNSDNQHDRKNETPAGTPYFALSLTYKPPNVNEDVKLPTQELLEKLKGDEKYDFVDTRTLASAGKWPSSQAALVSQARSLIDWNERNVVST